MAYLKKQKYTKDVIYEIYEDITYDTEGSINDKNDIYVMFENLWKHTNGVRLNAREYFNIVWTQDEIDAINQTKLLLWQRQALFLMLCHCKVTGNFDGYVSLPLGEYLNYTCNPRQNHITEQYIVLQSKLIDLGIVERHEY